MENIFCLESHIHLCSRHPSAIPAYVIKTCVTWHAISGTRYWGFVSPKLHVSTYRNQQHCWWFHYIKCAIQTSVRHTFLTMFPSSYHHEIFRSYYQWQKWRPCKRSRSKVKVTEVTTQLNRFQTVTPVWIHIWWWKYAYSLMMLRRGALLFFKVIRQIARSHGSKILSILTQIGRFRTVTTVWIHQWLQNAAQSLK